MNSFHLRLVSNLFLAFTASFFCGYFCAMKTRPRPYPNSSNELKTVEAEDWTCIVMGKTLKLWENQGNITQTHSSPVQNLM